MTENFTVAGLLEHLPEEGGLDSKKLEKILKLTKKGERQHLDIALNALNKLGILERNESGEIKRTNDNSLIYARLRCSSKGYCFALRDDGGEDIYIRDQYLNHAWNGDRVIVRITREGVRRRSPEGSVQCILERSSNNLLGLVEKDEDGYLAKPLDDRILAYIQLPESDKNYYKEDNEDNLVEIEIDNYPIAQFNAQGHVVKQHTLSGGYESDLELLLTKYNLELKDKFPRFSLKQPIQKIRKDLTSQPSLILKSWESKDSPTLPIVYIEPNKGGFRVWIHSASIAERIVLGNNLDLSIRQSMESVCLGKKWSKLITESLKKETKFVEGENNEAITISIDINSSGEVLDWEFCLSIVKPVAVITPEQLDCLTSRKPNAKTIPNLLKPIKEHIDQIKSLIYCSNLIRQSEKKYGIIELDLPIPKFDNLTDLYWQNPATDLHQWKLPIKNEDPQSLLSPLINTANRCWYNHSHNLGLASITLGAEDIDSNMLNDVAKSALALELELKLEEDGSPSAPELALAFANSSSRRALDKLLKHTIPEPYFKLNLPLNHNDYEDIEKRSISNINYNYDIQSPWCCPNVYYSDIVNQHIIVTLLKDGKTSLNARNKNKVNLGRMNCWNEIKWPLFTNSILNNINSIFTNQLFYQLNKKRRQSKSFRNGIICMAQARAAQGLVGTEIEASITGVQSYGFFVEIPPSMAEGLVHVSTLNDDWYEYRSRQNRLVGRKSRKTFQLGDLVRVKIINVDLLRNQIDLEIKEENSEDYVNKNAGDLNYDNNIQSNQDNN